MQYQKISPKLMAVVADYKDEGRKGLNRHLSSKGLVSAELSPKTPRAIVFIHTDENADLSHLAKLGVHVNQSIGRIRTAIIPLDRIGVLSEDRTIKRIVASSYLRLAMDVAKNRVGMPLLLQKHPELTGKGVIIGIIDSGINSDHPAFKGRIMRIWDQILGGSGGSGVPEGDYGLELTGEYLKKCQDEEWHGIHVAGIAAGNDAEFCGIAPEADLVVVKTDLNDAHIVDGIRYIFRIAEELGRPAVINISIGGQYGSHDGYEDLSQAISEASGPGRIVCCAAGNEGNDPIHAQINVLSGKKHAIKFYVPVSPVGSGLDGILFAGLEGWYSGSDKVDIAVQSPGGFITPYQSISVDGDPSGIYELPNAKVKIFTPGQDPDNGDNNFYIEITNPEGDSLPVMGGIWKLWLRGTQINKGIVDVWALDNSGSLAVLFADKSAQDGIKIGVPGSAKNAITVGSYATRVNWTDIDGQEQEMGYALNDISDFSNEGPLRNGEKKPDLIAPGEMIISCLSKDALIDRAWMINEEFGIMRGTSMSAPFIAGLIALLLQEKPQLQMGIWTN